MREHHEHHLRKLERLADLMDSRFTLPGTNIRLGLDSIIGLIPGIGDTLSLGISGYIVAEAHRLGASSYLIGKMIGNIAIDWLVGIIPFFGDIFDVGWKANRKNVALLKEHLKPTATQDGVKEFG
jgi:hypothetical protein